MRDLLLTRKDGQWLDFGGKRNQWYFTSQLQGNGICTALEIYEHSDRTCQHPEQ